MKKHDCHCIMELNLFLLIRFFDFLCTTTAFFLIHPVSSLAIKQAKSERPEFIEAMQDIQNAQLKDDNL